MRGTVARNEHNARPPDIPGHQDPVSENLSNEIHDDVLREMPAGIEKRSQSPERGGPMTNFATKHRSKIEADRPGVRPTLLVAVSVLSIVCQSTPSSADETSRAVSGAWELLSNGSPGTLTIDQSNTASMCHEITGTLDADDIGSIFGSYCLDELHINFVRFIDGEDIPFQMYEGYVSDDGRMMAGKFVHLGDDGRSSRATAPFVGER
jgi:hypothetical protein